MKGIFLLQGNRLKICATDDEHEGPTQFVAMPETIILVFHRLGP